MSSLDLISKGILPFLGNIRKFTPWLLREAAALVPMSDWHRWSYHDMTCGSCAVGSTFGFYGMSVTMNDLEKRSYIAAKSIMSGRRLTKPLIDAALNSGGGAPDGMKSARELIPHHLHETAADIFDKLFYAAERGDVPQEDEALLKFLAVRWVMANKTFMYFLKLPTHDLNQLALQGSNWAKVVRILRDPAQHLYSDAEEMNHLSHALVSARHEKAPVVLRGDCREMIKQVDFSRPSFVALNPPTAGNSVFMQSNRVLDTLIYSAPQNTSDDDMPGDLWKSLVLDTAKHVPAGHYIFGFCGDGALTWEEGKAVYDQIGETISTHTFAHHGREEKIAGLILLRRG